MLCLGGPLHGLHGRSAVVRGVFGALALLALVASPAFAQAPGHRSDLRGQRARRRRPSTSTGPRATPTTSATRAASDLTGVTLTDDQCSAISRPGQGHGRRPRQQRRRRCCETGETWRYTCTVKAADLFKTSSAPGHQHRDRDRKDQAGSTLTAKDTAVTHAARPRASRSTRRARRPRPPASSSPTTSPSPTRATPRSRRPASSSPTRSSPAAPAPPRRRSPTSKNGDRTPAELNPGETWVYQCQVADEGRRHEGHATRAT